MNLSDVIAFLEAESQATFDAGVFHQDELGTYSATEAEANRFERAAEALRDLQTAICGDSEA